MRVLLLHEMSGVHTELRAGLRAIGIDADIATYGDGWKKLPSDIYLGKTTGRFSFLERAANQFKNARKFRNYDVIQLLSPNPFTRPFDGFLNKYILDGGAKTIYIAAGSDAVYRKHVRSLPYYPPHDWYENDAEYKRINSVLEFSDVIVPVCYEYKYAMERDGRKCGELMPFPIDISKHKFKLAGKSNKIRFFHPLNRDNFEQYDFKGTKIIKKVFDDLSVKYSDVAEFYMRGGLPYDEYLKLTDSVDVIVDQLYSMSYGMSAAHGLAKGKVVVSGLEGMVKENTYYNSCPVINSQPDEESLRGVIEDLILNKVKISIISEESRVYAEKNHDYKKVAHLYLNIYS